MIRNYLSDESCWKKLWKSKIWMSLLFSISMFPIPRKWNPVYPGESSWFESSNFIVNTKNRKDCVIFQRYVEEGSNSKNQKIFENVTNTPLLTSSAEKKIIEIISVPELHLLLGNKKCIMQKKLLSMIVGVVEKLLREFENRVFQDKKVGKKFMDNYLKKVSFFNTILTSKPVPELNRVSRKRWAAVFA